MATYCFAAGGCDHVAESPTPACAGGLATVGQGQSCDACHKCGAGLACGYGVCGQACSSDADCNPEIGSLCLTYGTCATQGGTCQDDVDCEQGPCTKARRCSIACDPQASTGCAAGLTCSLVAHSGRVGTDCEPGCEAEVHEFYAAAPDGGSTVETEACGRYCVIGTSGTCPAGSTCSGLFGSPLTVGSTTYGVCRQLCDPWGPSNCPASEACLVSTEPPVTACALLEQCTLPSGDPCATEWVPSAGPYCATVADVGMACTPGACRGSGDCPAWATCQHGECLATPLPCDPLSPSTCGTRSCTVSVGSGGAEVACANAGTGRWPTACDPSSPLPQCGPGQRCVGYGDPVNGICESYCDVGTDPRGCSAPAKCVALDPVASVRVPSMGPPFVTQVFGTCALPCDPAAPQKACPNGGTCVPFIDSSGAMGSDCIGTTGSGTGPGACASSPSACAPGYMCRKSDKACVRWCYVGDPSSCPTGQSCMAASPAVAIGGVTYGTCQ